MAMNELMHQAFVAEIKKVKTDRLEFEFKYLSDLADKNDDEGGHVGISKYCRERIALIGEELNRRKTLKDDVGFQEVNDTLRFAVLFNGKVALAVNNLLDAMDAQHNSHFSLNVTTARDRLREYFPKDIEIDPDDIAQADKSAE